jgi:hypothetical protein
MWLQDLAIPLYLSFTIRIFRFHHPLTKCEVYIASHGPKPGEIIFIHDYLQYV